MHEINMGIKLVVATFILFLRRNSKHLRTKCYNACSAVIVPAMYVWTDTMAAAERPSSANTFSMYAALHEEHERGGSGNRGFDTIRTCFRKSDEAESLTSDKLKTLTMVAKNLLQLTVV